MKVKHIAAAAAAVVCLAATACSAATTSADPTSGAPTAGYPVTIRNCGKEYTFKEAPKRVVVMNGGSVAEVSALLELGLGDRIVANAQSYGASEVPGRAAAIAKLPTGDIKLNDMMDIPREAMIGLAPDFVISTYNGGFRAEAGFATREDLAAVGANTYAPESSCGEVSTVSGTPSIEDSYTLLRDLGRIFGVSEKAEKVIADSKNEIADIQAKVGNLPKKKAMLIIPGMAMGSEFSSVGGTAIWNDIMAKAGVDNVFATASDQMFANPSREQVAKADVEVLVVVDYMSEDPDADAAKLFGEFPQWDAAKKKSYVVLSDSIYLGPSNDIAVDKIAHVAHEEAF
ncbi:ABC transporter substrate-binding protein [Actinophytocola oryzae]|uniref:Iron complex transport system substrate-binding protein n=1 Tax=Actinophytocola oryzae TaxID=502181 RepID=A0A4V3FU27_9PSEU|nr:ABC transporter substrate-binding protein [Actinophytocola oryzae]TDV53611.1 iron complex transport system substrate-binding protein [Actinophytocola oryzae]